MSASRKLKRNTEKVDYANFCRDWQMAKKLQKKRYDDIKAEGREPTLKEIQELGRPLSNKPTFRQWKTLNLAAIRKRALQLSEATEQEQRMEIDWDGDSEPSSEDDAIETEHPEA